VLGTFVVWLNVIHKKIQRQEMLVQVKAFSQTQVASMCLRSWTCDPSNSWLWASTSVFARPWHSLTRHRYIRVLSAKSCWCMQWCQSLEADYGTDVSRWSILSSQLQNCLCNSFHGCFVPTSKKGQSVHTLVFVLLEFHVFSKWLLNKVKCWLCGQCLFVLECELRLSLILPVHFNCFTLPYYFTVLNYRTKYTVLLAKDVVNGYHFIDETVAQGLGASTTTS
jgi:hypothetical protein